MPESDYQDLLSSVTKIAESEGNKKIRLINVVRKAHSKLGHLPDEVIELIAKTLDVPRIAVDGVLSFYHFLGKEKKGQHVIYLDNSAVAEMMGLDKVAKAFKDAVGVEFGQTTADGKITLAETSCIGMSDQLPAAIIDGLVFTELTEQKAREIVQGLKKGLTAAQLVEKAGYGDGNNANPLVKAMVKNNLRKSGQVVFAPFESGAALRRAVSMSPEEVIEQIKVSKIRGRGGAGFPTGMKWDFCRRNPGPVHYVFCNADEGEPGTFKDRVILTEAPDLVFEGMTVAGYAIGSHKGILYLRHEYNYLLKFLEDVLEKRRAAGLLGENAAGKKGFNFEIRIQMGAGAYICGEESALINSTEGKRGEPRDRPPFPVQEGYLGQPTLVNNVETLADCARIIEKGGEWFAAIGTSQSSGTKLLSISGDCERPGVYELPLGMPIRMISQVAGAREVQAVQFGGPSGSCLGENDFDRRLCFDDLSTGGAMIIIGKHRDLLRIVYNFIRFFEHESCGWCVPCRAGTRLLKNKVKKLVLGRGTHQDIEDLLKWCPLIKSSARCGLGQTAPNPVLTTLENHRQIYDKRIIEDEYLTGFDLSSAVSDACEITGRAFHTHER